MYQPPHFREDRLEVLHAFVAAHPLGLLVSSGPGGLQADPVPFLIDGEPSGLGVLRAHLARANPQVKPERDGSEVLVVFQGADSYITPSWYATKRETGKVVPTWNYAMVQASGRLRLVDDGEWLAKQVGELTARHEGERSAPWAVSDAPAEFIAGQIKGIVGIEIEIEAIHGKWKASQNRPVADREGVAQGLDGETGGTEAAMAALVRERGGLPPR